LSPGTDLSGRAAVVTGGGRGIGAAVAHALAAAGARVVVAARSAGEIEAVAAAIASDGGEARAIACDVTDPDAVGRLRAEAESAFGAVGVVVNNAGVASSAPLRSLELEEWNRILAVNATSAFLPGMLAAGWGRVVNVASIAGLQGAPYIAAYAASKHALVGFTRAVAAEVAAKGITVNALCPGFVETPMTDASVGRIVARTGRSAEEARGAIVAMNPQGRLIEPEEVAFLALALCDERARGVNGQALAIDGGALLR